MIQQQKHVKNSAAYFNFFGIYHRHFNGMLINYGGINSFRLQSKISFFCKGANTGILNEFSFPGYRVLCRYCVHFSMESTGL